MWRWNGQMVFLLKYWKIIVFEIPSFEKWKLHNVWTLYVFTMTDFTSYLGRFYFISSKTQNAAPRNDEPCYQINLHMKLDHYFHTVALYEMTNMRPFIHKKSNPIQVLIPVLPKGRVVITAPSNPESVQSTPLRSSEGSCPKGRGHGGIKEMWYEIDAQWIWDRKGGERKRRGCEYFFSFVADFVL